MPSEAGLRSPRPTRRRSNRNQALRHERAGRLVRASGGPANRLLRRWAACRQRREAVDRSVVRTSCPRLVPFGDRRPLPVFRPKLHRRYARRLRYRQKSPRAGDQIVALDPAKPFRCWGFVGGTLDYPVAFDPANRFLRDEVRPKVRGFAVGVDAVHSPDQRPSGQSLAFPLLSDQTPVRLRQLGFRGAPPFRPGSKFRITVIRRDFEAHATLRFGRHRLARLVRRSGSASRERTVRHPRVSALRASRPKFGSRAGRRGRLVANAQNRSAVTSRRTRNARAVTETRSRRLRRSRTDMSRLARAFGPAPGRTPRIKSGTS